MSKKKGAAVAALIIMGVVVLGLAAAVYAKYLSSITKTGTATVAKWAFTTDNTSGTVVCELDHNYDAATLVNGKIAPGTSGKCPIQVSNATSEVGISYSIKPSATNQPTNLKFYKEASHTTEVSGSSAVTGTLNPGAAAQTIYVYWWWPYQTGTVTDGVAAGDTDDTANGTSAAAMTITFDVTGTQVEPTYN